MRAKANELYGDGTVHAGRRYTQAKSLFILWITGPCSSVRPSLARAWWLSATGYVAVFEPPPGRGGCQWLGGLPRHSAGVGIPHSCCQVTRSTAILAHSFPSPSYHGSAMARKSLIQNQTKPNQTKYPSHFLTHNFGTLDVKIQAKKKTLHFQVL